MLIIIRMVALFYNKNFRKVQDTKDLCKDVKMDPWPIFSLIYLGLSFKWVVRHLKGWVTIGLKY